MVTMSLLRGPKGIFAFTLGGTNSHSANEELSADDIIVAMLGSIGTGKSNFIDCLFNGGPVDPSYSPLASAGLTSPSVAQKGRAIKPIRIRDHHTYGNKLVVLDTPGYDNIDFSETDVLNMIKAFLKTSSKSDSGLTLSGIISCYRISDNRHPEHQDNLNVRLLSNLCTGHGLKRVVLMTTMWDKAKSEKTKVIFEKRLEGYRNHWGLLIQDGATPATFHNTYGSACGVISSLLEGPHSLASSRNVVPFPCPPSPIHKTSIDDVSDTSPSTDSLATTLRALPGPATITETELPVFSPISPISSTMARTFPLLLDSSQSMSPLIGPLLDPTKAGGLYHIYGAPVNRPGPKRPKLHVDFPHQITRQSSATKGDAYVPTPCPLSPNTSHMWLLADRVYLTPSLSVFE